MISKQRKADGGLDHLSDSTNSSGCWQCTQWPVGLAISLTAGIL